MPAAAPGGCLANRRFLRAALFASLTAALSFFLTLASAGPPLPVSIPCSARAPRCMVSSWVVTQKGGIDEGRLNDMGDRAVALFRERGTARETSKS
jgi:hypothetical protein